MGEAFLVAFLQVLVDKLTYREVFKYFGLIKGPTQKLNKWNDMLIKIEAVVNEAEKRQLTTENKPLRLWLNDLRDLAYDMEDVLDKYATKMLKRQVQYSIPNSVFNFKMNTEIQKITDRLQEICQQKELLGLNNIHTGGSIGFQKQRSRSRFIECTVSLVSSKGGHWSGFVNNEEKQQVYVAAETPISHSLA